MKNKKKSPSLINQVLDKVQSGQVKMRPKRYFILRAVLIGLITCLVALFALYLVSFIFFSLRASGVWFLPGFGFQAIGVFFSSLPWLLILTALILIIVLEILVKRFAFAYRRPILYSILAIIILTLLGSLVIAKTPFHSDIFWKAQEGKLLMAGGFYRGFGLPKLANVHCGVVSEITDDGFYLETKRGEKLTVLVSSTTRSIGAKIEKDDQVVVLGKRYDDRIEAFGCRKVDKQFDIFRRQSHRQMPWYK